MGTLIKDVRNAARTLFHWTGFTLVAAFVIALFVLPVVWEKSTPRERDVILPADYPDWKSRNHVFGDTAAVVNIFPMSLTGSGKPEELLAGAVTSNFFQMIGVRPVIGRAFLPEEGKGGRQHVAILSEGLWRRRFGGNPAVVGKSIRLSGELYRVIGILPPDFAWNNHPTDVWVPYVADPNRDYRAAGYRQEDRFSGGVAI